MRNNEERFNTPIDDGDGEVMSSSNNSLSFVAPTEFVELPSAGKYYSSNHPLRDKQEIEIKFMTAKEEDILTSRSLLKKGIAIDRMLENLIVDKNISLGTLLTGDKNAIMVAARISAYGPKYSVELKCPSCEKKQKLDLNLMNIDKKESETSEERELETTANGTFICKLPRTGIVAEFRLLTSQDESNIAQKILKEKEDSIGSTGMLKTLLVSVNGQTDPKTISTVVDNLPAVDARVIRTHISKLTPDINMTFDFVCESCEHEDRLEVPLTAEFFWPKQ